MNICRACPLFLVLSALAACQSAPTAPTVIEAPGVAPVATAQPYVWDSADELAAWVSNGVSTGPVSVAGDGAAAVIRMDLAGGEAKLHGPDLVPPPNDVQAVVMRYRWVDPDQAGGILISVYLRPPQVSDQVGIPRLFPPIGRDLSEIRSGNWLEKTLMSNGSSRPPYSVRYLLFTLYGSTSARPTRPVQGALEIDWIALTR
jgi:hypothetical protein